MDLDQTQTQSFIVRIWLEETAEEAGHVVWRGHVTHVPSGERLYVEDLDGISWFVIPYLERMGIKLSLGWRVKRWLGRRKH